MGFHPGYSNLKTNVNPKVKPTISMCGNALKKCIKFLATVLHCVGQWGLYTPPKLMAQCVELATEIAQLEVPMAISKFGKYI